MAELRKLTAPVMARCASRDADEAGRKSLEERQHLRPPQRPFEGHFSGLGNSVDMEDGLGQVEAYSGDLNGVVPVSFRF